jgi:hypothetical protein
MTPLRIPLIAILLLTTSVLQACNDNTSQTSAKQGAEATSSDLDPRSKVIGVTPQPAKAEGPSTTAGARSSITRQQESNSMPLPGQANDHSNPVKDATQKSTPAPKKSSD